MSKKVISYKEYLALIGYKPKETRSRYEISDPVPMAPPLGYQETPDLIDQIRMMIRQENWASDNSPIDETFEEADDFDVGDDIDPQSPYEDDFEPRVFVKAPTAAERSELEAGVEPITPPPSDKVAPGSGVAAAGPSQKKGTPAASD